MKKPTKPTEKLKIEIREELDLPINRSNFTQYFQSLDFLECLENFSEKHKVDYSQIDFGWYQDFESNFSPSYYCFRTFVEETDEAFNNRLKEYEEEMVKWNKYLKTKKAKIVRELEKKQKELEQLDTTE